MLAWSHGACDYMLHRPCEINLHGERENKSICIDHAGRGISSKVGTMLKPPPGQSSLARFREAQDSRMTYKPRLTSTALGRVIDFDAKRRAHMQALTRNRIRDPREWKSWYQTPWWYKHRRAQLRRESQCRMCQQPATVVDHVTPHKGHRELFFNAANLQSLCQHHHDTAKRSQESKPRGSKLDGTPLVPQPGW